MKTVIVRSPETDRRAIDIPEDPFDLTGIAVDYQEAVSLVFPSGVSTRMQYDTPIIASNFVTTGAAWEWTAPSTALYHFIAQATMILRAGIEYHLAIVVYKNGAIYKGGAVAATPVSASAQTVGITTIIPCNRGDTLHVEISVTTSDSGDTILTNTSLVNFVNILRLWKTWQQELGIPSNVAPPVDGGGGSHARG